MRGSLPEAGGARGALLLRTPEEVSLRFRAGDPGSRIGALVLDFLLLNLFLLAVSLAMIPALGGGHLTGAIFLVGGFLARTFYFPWFELRWQGRTPGKRSAGLRVVSRDGGPLTAEMVFARNLTRELEVFLPLSVLLSGGALFPDAPPWLPLAALAWALALMLIPLLNRQHLRVGDLLAGTVVVVEPKAVLLPDLAGEARDSAAHREYVFTREQLEIYGIEELEVLEEVLRRPPSPHHEELLARLARTIRRKVDWRSPPGRPALQPERFLQAFYAAQRQRLEQELLVGRRRERKVG